MAYFLNTGNWNVQLPGYSTCFTAESCKNTSASQSKTSHAFSAVMSLAAAVAERAFICEGTTAKAGGREGEVVIEEVLYFETNDGK